MRHKDDLEREVAAVGDLSREELVERWQRTYSCPPPKGISRHLLERSAAWHLQARRLGGLSAAARAGLRVGSRSTSKSSRVKPGIDVATEGAARTAPSLPPTGPAVAVRKPAAPPLAIGTRLMREWNGRMHVVDITQRGILFDGKIYRSLSSVAKRITGTHWSGPRFFGL